jgi:hypothetical protein
LDRFSGAEARVDDVEEYVLVDTAFRETHYRGILSDLENEGQIEIVKTSRKRRNAYPAGTIIRFR